MSKVDELEKRVKRLEPTNGPSVLVDVTFLELKQLLAVVRAAKQLRDYTKTWDYYRSENISREEKELDATLAALEGGE